MAYQTFPIHVVCEWIGNSEAVAKQHYLQVNEDHMTRGSDPGQTLPPPTGKPTEVLPSTTPVQKLLQRAANALQTGQKPTEIDRNGSDAAQDSNPMKKPGKLSKKAVFPGFSDANIVGIKWALREQNPAEVTGESIGESGVLVSGPRPCAANALQMTTELSGNVVDSLTLFPELVALVNAWPGMTERERNAVLRAAMTGQR